MSDIYGRPWHDGLRLPLLLIPACVVCLALGFYVGRLFPASEPAAQVRLPEAEAKLAQAHERIETLTASVSATRSALEAARATQAEVEVRTEVRYVRAREREAEIKAQPPTEQGAVESLERAAEFERRQEERR